MVQTKRQRGHSKSSVERYNSVLQLLYTSKKGLEIPQRLKWAKMMSVSTNFLTQLMNRKLITITKLGAGKSLVKWADRTIPPSIALVVDMLNEATEMIKASRAKKGKAITPPVEETPTNWIEQAILQQNRQLSNYAYTLEEILKNVKILVTDLHPEIKE